MSNGSRFILSVIGVITLICGVGMLAPMAETGSTYGPHPVIGMMMLGICAGTIAVLCDS